MNPVPADVAATLCGDRQPMQLAPSRGGIDETDIPWTFGAALLAAGLMAAGGAMAERTGEATAGHPGPGKLRGRRNDDAKPRRIRCVQAGSARGPDLSRRSRLRILPDPRERAEAAARAVARCRAILQDMGDDAGRARGLSERSSCVAGSACTRSISPGAATRAAAWSRARSRPRRTSSSGSACSASACGRTTSRACSSRRTLRRSINTSAR